MRGCLGSLLKSALFVCHKAAHQKLVYHGWDFHSPLMILFPAGTDSLVHNKEDFSSTFCDVTFSNELKHNAALYQRQIRKFVSLYSNARHDTIVLFFSSHHVVA